MDAVIRCLYYQQLVWHKSITGLLERSKKPWYAFHFNNNGNYIMAQILNDFLTRYYNG